MPRLVAVIERQRRELDRIRAAAAAGAVVAMARGALMERLGLSATEAGAQLAELSEATGVPLAEMAAAVLSPPEGDPSVGDLAAAGSAAPPADNVAAAGSTAGPQPGRPEAAPGRDEPRLPSLLAEIGAELAADGAELAGTLAEQVLSPLGATAVVLWLLAAGR